MTRIIIALIVSIAMMVYLTTKTNVSALVSMMISGLVLGLISGLSITTTISSITEGFGSTCGNIGIVILLGAILGSILERSHSCECIADFFIKITGEKHVGIALAIAGYIIAIPIFADVALIIMAPIVIAVAKKSKQSLIKLGTITTCSLLATNQFVVPTSQPLTVVTLLDINIAYSIVVGLIVAAILTIAIILSCNVLLNKQENEKDIINSKEYESGDKYPKFYEAIIPILAPLLLIASNSILPKAVTNELIISIVSTIGEKHISLGIGIIIALIMLTKYIDKDEKANLISSSIKSAGPIIIMTCMGGGIAKITQAAGINEMILNMVNNISIPILLIPFFITALMEFASGSGSAAVIVGSSIVLPLIEQGVLNPLVAFVAINAGTNLGCHINSSFFWVFTESFSLDTKTSLNSICLIRNVIMSSVGLLCAFVLSIFLV